MARKKPTTKGTGPVAALAGELQRGPITPARFELLVEYLDYVDHARYSHAELTAMLDGLVAEGLARRTAAGWSWIKPRKARSRTSSRTRS